MYDLDAVAAGLQNLFQLHVLASLLVGFALGFIVGAIPGFNDANLMAILLPFTLFLDAMTAIVAMSALYFGAQAAGSIPAILINVPGTPGTAASTLEGYPMARRGQAGLALGISFAASTFGAVFGSVAAIVLSPIIGAFALRFGPAEMFMIAVFGLTVVSSLTGDDIWKGLLASAFGVLIAMVGADGMTAFERGTFGILHLYDGVPLIPVLLGLFGFSEVLFLMREQAVASGESVRGKGEIFRGVRECLRHRVTLLRSSIIGTIIGIIPGAGATIGSFVAYGQARQWSREPEKFGTGHPDGLVATDSANNAVAAGAVVPLLTLGLPGSASATVMLAALVLHGVRPGPRFFLNFQTEAYTILFSLFIASALIALVGLPAARSFRAVAFLPTRILVPIVGVLLFTGAFAWRFLGFDILVMVVFGLLGVAMKVGGYPIPAFLLAFILGSLLETCFLQTVRIGGYGLFFGSPITITLWVLTILSLLAPVIMKLGRRRDKARG
ncbi:MAG TPA: tripartite tricarboxylate transporter permease [Thermodesulfobacteriota bacterium]